MFRNPNNDSYEECLKKTKDDKSLCDSRRSLI